MTRDDIIRIAKEAGFADGIPEIMGLEGFYNFAALVAAAEREACAEILLEYAGRDDLLDSDESLLKHLFDLIRARGET